MLREIFQFFFKIAEFVYSVDKYQPLLAAQKQFLDGEEAENIKYSLSSALPKIAKHLHQPKMFNGGRVFAHSLVIDPNGVLGADPLLLAIWGIYYEK